MDRQGGTPLCIFCGPHNQKVNLKDRKFFLIGLNGQPSLPIVSSFNMTVMGVTQSLVEICFLYSSNRSFKYGHFLLQKTQMATVVHKQMVTSR